MNYPANHEITLSDGKVIKFYFNTRVFEAFTDLLKIEYEDLQTKIYEGEVFKNKNIKHILSMGAENYFFFNDIEERYTEKDVFVWMDQIGATINFPQIQELFMSFLSAFTKIDRKQFELKFKAAMEGQSAEEKPDTEDKKKAGTKKSSPGVTSTNSQLKRA